MSVTREQWKRGYCPVTGGLFHADGTARSATLDRKSRVLRIGEPHDLPPDLDFVELGSYETGRFQCPRCIVRWGGGPWESEGWIALEEASGELTWLLHLVDSEPFTQARFEDDMVEAVAYGYPCTTVFQIPAMAPQEAISKSESAT
jgi:hypothetical protein